jgi:hypothetical protein
MRSTDARVRPFASARSCAASSIVAGILICVDASYFLVVVAGMG